MHPSRPSESEAVSDRCELTPRRRRTMLRIAVSNHEAAEVPSVVSGPGPESGCCCARARDTSQPQGTNRSPSCNGRLKKP